MSDETQTPAPAEKTEAPAWYGKVSPETEGFIKNAGWGGIEDVVKAHRSLTQLQRTPAQRTLVVPEKEDDVEGWNQVYARLGRPEKPEAYKLANYAPVDGQPDLVSGDDGFLAQAHRLGLSQKAANELFDWYAKRAGDFEDQTEEQLAVAHTAGLDKMRAEWGQAYDRNLGTAKHAVAQLGFAEDELKKIEDTLGTEWLLKTLHRIGAQFVGESEGVPRNPEDRTSGLGVSPFEAQARLESLMHDPAFYHKYMEGHPDARRQVEQLTQAIAGTQPVRPSLVANR